MLRPTYAACLFVTDVGLFNDAVSSWGSDSSNDDDDDDDD